MSSSRRGISFSNRWGQVALREDKNKTRKKEYIEYLDRVVKRMNIATGYKAAKVPFEWYCTNSEVDQEEIMVIAFTKSEARSLFKKELGLGKNQRLPKKYSIHRGGKVYE